MSFIYKQKYTFRVSLFAKYVLLIAVYATFQNTLHFERHRATKRDPDKKRKKSVDKKEK